MPDLQVYRDWFAGPLLPALRQCFSYGPGDDRATGYLYTEPLDWPPPLELLGHEVLQAVRTELGQRFAIVAFQAYRNGSGTPWHADTPFGAQAILSLGAMRTFEYRRTGGGSETRLRVADGDLVYMPPGFQQEWEHRVPEEDVTGERVSLVFRTKA